MQRQRSVLAVVLLIIALTLISGLFIGLRTVTGLLSQQAAPSGFYTPRVVVVGVSDRTGLTEVDRDLVGEYDVEAGAVLTGGRCAASGWATLSAMTPVEIDCAPAVTDIGVVEDWRDREAEAARTAGNLGALAGDGPNCVSAVGPLAAIGAAREDATTAEHLDVDGFIGSGYRSACPLVLVDAGDRADEVIRGVAGLDDVSLVVVGLGGSAEAQLIYRLGTTLPGWMTSAATDRTGVVTLPDLARTLHGFVSGEPVTDGLGVVDLEESLSPDQLSSHVAGTDRLVSVPTAPLVWIAAAMAGIVLAGAVAWWRGRGPVRTTAPVVVATIAASLPPALLLAGVTAWWRSEAPGRSLGVAVAIAWLVVAGLTGASAWGKDRRSDDGPGAPAGGGIVGWRLLSVVTFLICVTDAALDGFLRRNSVLAVRPMSLFSGFDGSVTALLLVSAVGVGFALVWRAKGTVEKEPPAPTAKRTGSRDLTRSQQPAVPFDRLARPIAVLFVAAMTVLAVVWTARIPSVLDLLGFAAVAAWCGVSGWMLARLR